MPLTRLELVLSYTPNWILSPTRLPIPPQGRGLYIYSIFNFCRSLAVDGVYLTSPRTILNRSRRQSATRARIFIYSIFNFCRSLVVDGVYLTSPRTILNRSRRQSATRARIIYLFYFQLLPKLSCGWRLPHLSSNDT